MQTWFNIKFPSLNSSGTTYPLYIVYGVNNINIDVQFLMLLNETIIPKFFVTNQPSSCFSDKSYSCNRSSMYIDYIGNKIQIDQELQAYTLTDLLQSILVLISPMFLVYQVAFGKSKLDPFGLIDYLFLKKYHKEKIIKYKEEDKMQKIINDYYIETKIIEDIFEDSDNSDEELKLIKNFNK